MSDKYRDKLDELTREVEGLDGLKFKMARDLLEAYVEVYEDYEQLNLMLDEDGLLIEVEKGAAGNHRIEKVKNPAFDMRRNCVSQMADLTNKIYRFVKDVDGREEQDAFDAFIAG